ncbi:MAG: hypothetical protein APF76_12795 [Desulfitibacter sp. BRH_c19]|nr:MAG: hypothetical protein APF76_12795 [Desulfitibacter sp. BRH_c19]
MVKNTIKGDDPFMQNLQDKTVVKELAKECHTVEDVHERVKGLFKETLQEIFEAEIEDQLGYERHSPKGNNSGNSRNGFSNKTIKRIC